MTFEPDGELDLIVAECLRDRAAHATVHSRGMGDVRRRVRRRRQRQMAVGLVPAIAGVGWVVSRPATHAPLNPSGEAGPCAETATTWPAGDGATVPFTIDPIGDTLVPYTGPTAPPWTTTTVPSLATWPAVNSTTTTICETTSVPASADVPVTTSFGDSTTTTSIVVGDVTATKVQVANCSAQNGVARMMSSVLADVGFVLADPVNGTCDPKIGVSYVIYDETVPGARNVAEALALVLGGLQAEPGILPLRVESAAWADGSGVVLYLGNDLAGKTLSQIQGVPASETSRESQTTTTTTAA